MIVSLVKQKSLSNVRKETCSVEERAIEKITMMKTRKKRKLVQQR